MPTSATHNHTWPPWQVSLSTASPVLSIPSPPPFAAAGLHDSACLASLTGASTGHVPPSINEMQLPRPENFEVIPVFYASLSGAWGAPAATQGLPASCSYFPAPAHLSVPLLWGWIISKAALTPSAARRQHLFSSSHGVLVSLLPGTEKLSLWCWGLNVVWRFPRYMWVETYPVMGGVETRETHPSTALKCVCGDLSMEIRITWGY